MKNIIGILFLSLLLLLSPVWAAPGQSGPSGLIQHDHSSNAKGSALLNCAAPCSTRACTTGYVRQATDFCLMQNVDLGTFTSLTSGACTSVTATYGPVPASATMLLVRVNVTARAANAAGVLRSAFVTAWDDSGCGAGNQIGIVGRAWAWEFSAVASGTVLGDAYVDMLVPRPAWIVLTRDAGNQSIASFQLRGYYD